MAIGLFSVQDQCVEGQTEKLMEDTKEPRSVCVGRIEGQTVFMHHKFLS